MPAAYWTTRRGAFWVAHSEHFGELAADCTCQAQAEGICADHAEAIESPANEAVERLEIAVRDFLHALDRGDFGDSLCVGLDDDRAESAFVTGMRRALSESEVDRALISAAHRRGAAIADALYGEARS